MSKKDQGLCSHPRCTNVIHAQARCATHYRALRADQAKACSKRRCTEPQHANGLCRSHYAKARRAA
jgi:hypothetical protein